MMGTWCQLAGLLQAADVATEKCWDYEVIAWKFTMNTVQMDE